MNGTVLALNLIGSCSLTWANDLPCLKIAAQCWLWFWLDLAPWREPMSVLIFSSVTVMDVKTARCWLWICLDLALLREPMSFLVFSSATVMDVKTGTMLDLNFLDLALWRVLMSFLVFSSATVMHVNNGTVLALNLIESCSLMWANYEREERHNVGMSQWASVWWMVQCWLWIWLDLTLWPVPIGFLVFSSATVMEVKTGTVLALNLIGSSSLTCAYELPCL